MASAYGLPVIPHGVGAPTYHFVSRHTIVCAPSSWTSTTRWALNLRGDPVPKNGFVELSNAPGFGYELDEDVIAGKANVALIY